MFKRWVCLRRRKIKKRFTKRLTRNPRRVLEKSIARVRDRDRDRVRKKSNIPAGIEE